MNNILLEVNNLKTVFKTDEGIVHAVNGISFNIAKGETVGIVGESGCGKSVTFLSLLGLIPEPPGKVIGGKALFEGHDILNIPEEQKRKIRGKDIALIFQDPMTSLNPYLRISTQMVEGPMLHLGISKSEALQVAIDKLKLVGIPEPEKRIHSYPHQFSGGMRQRVMIAMALTTNPKLLVADEPTTALDVTIQAQILELLKEMKSKTDLSLILITHNLGVVAGMADRIIVMYAGFIAEENKTDGLFSKPRHPYTAALLRSVPKANTDSKEPLYTISGAPPNLVQLPSGCPFHPRCERAIDKCHETIPPLETAADDSRLACHNPY